MKNIDLEKENGRSLLAESGADAPAVLSAVYTDSTQTKNRQADVPQYGRSMIEMLGVLAIIGVLSVGGIAGYSKAMQKYRINKTIEQITLIAGNIRTFFAPQKSYSLSGYSGRKIIKKAKLFPDDIPYEEDQYGIVQWKNVWGGEIGVCETNKSDTGSNKAFYLFIYDIPEEACIELLTHDWRNVGSSFVTVNADENEYFSGTDRFAFVPVDLDVAIKMCSSTPYWAPDVALYFDIDENYYKEDYKDCLAENGDSC